jgi:ABC-type multidrug transport system fused ATPase/permease subunit
MGFNVLNNFCSLMIKKINYFFSIFLKAELSKGVWILLLTFFVALLEIIGIASMMPFFGIIGNPNTIQKSKLLTWLYSYFTFSSSIQFISFLGFSIIGVIIFSNMIKGYSAYINNKFIGELRLSLQSRLLRNYIKQPYSFFLNKNSSELNKIIWSDIEFVISYIVTPFIQIVSNGILLILIMTIIAILQFKTAIILGLIVSVFLFLFVIIVRMRDKNAAFERGEAAKGSFVVLNEILGGIKDIKVYQKEENFSDKFIFNSKVYANLWAKSATLAQLPKFVLETMAFGILISVTLVILYTNNDLGMILPILGLYAFAAYKIVPAVQVIFQGVASFKQGWPSLVQIHDDILLSVDSQFSDSNVRSCIPFKNQISFNDIYFNYIDTDNSVLNGINFSIQSNTTVGIVGGTGAGKTTLIDLILGLHKPIAGNLKVDNNIINSENISQWKNMIGYVPQQIFLTDATIEENIAFGIPKEEINFDQLQNAARLASIDDFIQSELPNKYKTIVGERGVRLSGGQRQRIGIARALYSNPKVLILDEATSSLDNLTESFIINALEKLNGKCTIVIVAHRFSTIKHCDKIVVLANGKVVSEGKFDELIIKSNEFKKLSLIS